MRLGIWIYMVITSPFNLCICFIEGSCVHGSLVMVETIQVCVRLKWMHIGGKIVATLLSPAGLPQSAESLLVVLIGKVAYATYISTFCNPPWKLCVTKQYYDCDFSYIGNTVWTGVAYYVCAYQRVILPRVVEMNTTVSLEWVHKWLVATLHIFVVTRHSGDKKKTILNVSLTLFPFCWWRQNRLHNCYASMWNVISNLLIMNFMHFHIHTQSWKIIKFWVYGVQWQKSLHNINLFHVSCRPTDPITSRSACSVP